MPNNNDDDDDWLSGESERMEFGASKKIRLVTCIRKSWSLLNSTKMNHRCCWPFFYEGNEQYCTSGFQRPFLLEDTQWKLSCWNFNDMFIMISLLIYVFIALEKYTIFIYIHDTYSYIIQAIKNDSLFRPSTGRLEKANLCLSVFSDPKEVGKKSPENPKSPDLKVPAHSLSFESIWMFWGLFFSKQLATCGQLKKSVGTGGSWGVVFEHQIFCKKSPFWVIWVIWLQWRDEEETSVLKFWLVYFAAPEWNHGIYPLLLKR